VSATPADVAVVIPALNEAKTVGGVVRRVRAVLPDATVIVVDDGSTDGTGAVAKAAGADVVTHRAPAGYSTALQDGFAAAIARGAHQVVQLDADGQHRPEDIPRLLADLERFDVVIGSRFTGASYDMGPARRVGIALCQVMVRACGLRVSDPTSGLRAMRSAVAADIAEHGYPDGLTESSYLIGLTRRGVSISEVPVTMHASASDSMHDGLGGVLHFGRIVRASARAALRRDGHGR